MVRALAVLKLKKRTNEILVFAQHVADSMRDNPRFSPPPAVLAKLPGHIAAARHAQAAVLTRTVGLARRRDVKVRIVRDDLDRVRVHVQRVADVAGGEEAVAIIVSAGLFVKGRIARGKQTLAAKPGRMSGVVLLTAKFAGKTAAYFWAWSVDQVTWTELPKTLKAKTRVDGLVPGTIHYFRSRALTRTGMTDWTTPIAFLVV
jgi:hypothetical protein